LVRVREHLIVPRARCASRTPRAARVALEWRPFRRTDSVAQGLNDSPVNVYNPVKGQYIGVTWTVRDQARRPAQRPSRVPATVSRLPASRPTRIASDDGLGGPSSPRRLQSELALPRDRRQDFIADVISVGGSS